MQDASRATIQGPCQILFGGIDLGHTLDGVTFTAERDFADVKVDKFGDMPIDKILTGSRVMVNVKLAQPNFRQLDVSMPETSSATGTGNNNRVDLGADAGYSLRQDAKQLVIHPMRNAISDASEDITLYLAVSVETVELPLKIDEQKVVEVTFQALPVETFGPGRRLGHIGSAVLS